MKILVASYKLPFPVQDGESLRVYPMVKRLAARHELDFVGFGADPVPPELENVFQQVVRVAQSPEHSPPHLGRFFAADRWFTKSPELTDRIAELLADKRYDLIWLTTMELVPYFAERPSAPLFIDVLDDAVLEHLRDVRQSRSVSALLHNLLRLLVAFRFERTYYRNATLDMVSERDAGFISRIVPGAHTVVIHNGVDADLFQPLGTPPHHPSVIFEGTMDFPPNVDAVLYFHREILPLVKREEPQTVYYVVGRNPTAEIRALAGPDTIVTGSVDDVRPYYDRASVFACTMRRGAGLKNKILQAWAMARPVVATPIATGGLRFQPGVNLEVAEGPTAIAAALVKLLRDPEARQRLGQAGRETVLTHYSWDQKHRELESAFADCVARGQRPASAW